MQALTAGQSSPAAGAVRKPRDPTPDHPPYSWMIGEAITALGEDGGSAEDAISGFIRGRHPGVPAAHDKFLRHYLAKHVAEGLFVCVAPGRYACRPDETELALPEVPAEKPPPAAEAKRGRGRPRKDGSWPASPAGKEKVGSELTSATPRRRGRSRFLALAAATGVSSEALLTDMEVDGSEAPSTAEPHELALMVANDDGSATAAATLDDGGGAPSAKLALVPKEPAAFSTPERSTQLAKLVPVAADEGYAPSLAADEEHGMDAPWSKYKRRRRSCSSAPAEATHGSAPASIADKAAGKTLPATPKGRGRQHKSAPVTSAASDGTPNKARSVPVKPRCQPRKLFQLTAGEVPDRLFCVLALPAPTAAATK